MMAEHTFGGMRSDSDGRQLRHTFDDDDHEDDDEEEDKEEELVEDMARSYVITMDRQDTLQETVITLLQPVVTTNILIM